LSGIHCDRIRSAEESKQLAIEHDDDDKDGCPANPSCWESEEVSVKPDLERDPFDSPRDELDQSPVVLETACTVVTQRPRIGRCESDISPPDCHVEATQSYRASACSSGSPYTGKMSEE
jgi:hypothetical protein